MNRPERPRPRVFDEFPEHAICPLCNTSDQGQCVLIPIETDQMIAEIEATGSAISEAKPVHLSCLSYNLRYLDALSIVYCRVE